MARNLITLAFVALLWLVATPSAHAMYSPTLGCFINRDPGVGLDKDGRPRINGQQMAASQGRSIQRGSRLAFHPYGGRGYHDGMSLYRAYFIPNGLDPWGLEDFPVDCGTASINTAGGTITWGFTRDPAKKCCCESTGWIQHTRQPGFDPPWAFDNAGMRPPRDNGGGGLGAPSNPQAPNQPVTKPPGGGPGSGTPWYPGPNDDPANPKPHDEGSDTPTPPGKGEGSSLFILQLICQDNGKVLFSYSWSIDNSGKAEGDGAGTWQQNADGSWNVK